MSFIHEYLAFSSAAMYVKIMKKIVEKGTDYVKTETERLGRMLSKLTHTT